MVREAVTSLDCAPTSCTAQFEPNSMALGLVTSSTSLQQLLCSHAVPTYRLTEQRTDAGC